MIYGNHFVNAACAILIIGGFAALLICSPWIGLGVSVRTSQLPHSEGKSADRGEIAQQLRGFIR